MFYKDYFSMSEPTKPRFEPTLGIFMLVQSMRF
nr:MAG TPA: hypothetical protein [Caudoviricetes sp.]